MEKRYFVLWDNDEMQECTVTSKAAAMKAAREYKRAWSIVDRKPIKAFTADEASAYRKAKCLENIADMKESCERWEDLKKYVPLYERGYKVLEKLLKHNHDIDKSNHLILAILSNLEKKMR